MRYVRRQKAWILAALVLLIGGTYSGVPLGQRAAAQQPNAVERDFFFANGEKVSVAIALDQIGVLAGDGVSAGRIKELAASRGLQLLREFPGGIFILGLREAQDRASLVKLARELEQQSERLIVRAGLVATPPEAEAPLIFSDEFISEFDPTLDPREIEAINNAYGVEIVMENPFVNNQYLLRVTEASAGDSLAIANRYEQDGKVSFSHPDFVRVVIEREIIPNDPLFANQWHHRNAGASGGTVDADADTSRAWDMTTGSAGVVIAVIDGGFDATHPDLVANFWANPGEVAGNGIDDDGNSFVDDVIGWDFTGCASSPGTSCGDNTLAGGSHGTAVAGVAAARGNNALGVSGACPQCRLMLLRQGGSFFADGLAFGYAQQRGAHIITNSWGYSIGTPVPSNVSSAINNAAALGRGGLGSVILFAMNNGDRNDCIGSAPDISALSNVIAVSAASNQDRKVTESAWGNCMDILAPTHRGYGGGTPFSGTLNIATTDVTGAGGYNNASPVASCPSVEPADRNYTLCFGGTSSATPLAAGVAGLVLSTNGGLTRIEVQRLLQDTADKMQDAAGRYATNTGFSTLATGMATHGYGRINAYDAVRVAAPVAQGGRGGVDVFIRDNRLDWGNTEQPSNMLFEPTRGFLPHWQSVDIKVDALPYQPAPTTSTAFDAFVDENPRSGELNRVYVRVHNRGPVPASGVTVKLHWAFAGTGLPALPPDFWTAFPADSTDTTLVHPLGTQSITNLTYSGSSVAGTAADAAQIVQFNFPGPPIDPAQPEPNHFCLFAVVSSPQDAVEPASTTSLVIDNITPRDNNITHRNVRVEESGRRQEFIEQFYVRNPTERPIRTVLTLGDPRGIPQGWKIELDKFGFNEPFPLQPYEQVLVTLRVALPEPNLEGEVTVTQFQLDNEQPTVVGGMTYQFKPSFQIHYQ